MNRASLLLITVATLVSPEQSLRLVRMEAEQLLTVFDSQLA